MTFVRLEHSTEVVDVHDAGACAGGVCPIHHRSGHRMRGWPQHWRGVDLPIERVCPHGVGHPDPDDPLVASGAGIHGCDGCCQQ